MQVILHPRDPARTLRSPHARRRPGLRGRRRRRGAPGAEEQARPSPPPPPIACIHQCCALMDPLVRARAAARRWTRRRRACGRRSSRTRTPSRPRRPAPARSPARSRTVPRPLPHGPPPAPARSPARTRTVPRPNTPARPWTPRAAALAGGRTGARAGRHDRNGPEAPADTSMAAALGGGDPVPHGPPGLHGPGPPPARAAPARQRLRRTGRLLQRAPRSVRASRDRACATQVRAPAPGRVGPGWAGPRRAGPGVASCVQGGGSAVRAEPADAVRGGGRDVRGA